MDSEDSGPPPNPEGGRGRAASPESLREGPAHNTWTPDCGPQAWGRVSGCHCQPPGLWDLLAAAPRRRGGPNGHSGVIGPGGSPRLQPQNSALCWWGCQKPPFPRCSWGRHLLLSLGPPGGRSDTVVPETGKGCRALHPDLQRGAEPQSGEPQAQPGTPAQPWGRAPDACLEGMLKPRKCPGSELCPKMFQPPPSFREDRPGIRAEPGEGGLGGSLCPWPLTTAAGLLQPSVPTL